MDLYRKRSAHQLQVSYRLNAGDAGPGSAHVPRVARRLWPHSPPLRRSTASVSGTTWTPPPTRNRLAVLGESPSRGLIDTNILIHLAALDPTSLPDEMVNCAVTLAELSAGPHYSDDPVERARRTRLLQHVEAVFDPLPFDAGAARAFGLVSAAALASARHPRRRPADLMIASVALVGQIPLYTTNPDDFRDLDHLLAIHPVAQPTT